MPPTTNSYTRTTGEYAGYLSDPDGHLQYVSERRDEHAIPMRLIVNIDVPELAPAIDFYTTAFELECSRILDEDVAELVGSSSTIYLLRNAPGTICSKRSEALRNYEKHWTPVHVDFVVRDVEAASKRAIQAGAVRQSDSVEWLGSKCITFSDPFGNGFCLIEFAEDSYATRAK
jgi:predicted enzyme related to lactoylglutathione lyase